MYKELDLRCCYPALSGKLLNLSELLSPYLQMRVVISTS